MEVSIVASRLVAGAAVVIGLALPAVSVAQQCPPELAEANTKLGLLRAAPPTQQTAQATDVYKPRGLDLKPSTEEPPRTLAGARQDTQAPRGQDVQAPRGQDTQAPRGQDVQAPRGQDVQAPRAPAGSRVEDAGSSKLERSSKLVEEAERACNAGDMTLSTEKAKAALDVLN
jgi:hypothetical protein